MNHWLGHTVQHWQLGEALISNGFVGIGSSWRNSLNAIDRLWTRADRWQSAIRQMRAPVNLAEILRSRHSV